MIKFLLTILIIYFVGRWVLGFLLRLWLSNMVRKGGYTATFGRGFPGGGHGPFGAQQPPRPQQPQRPEGQVRVENPNTNHGRSATDGAGEYIDFEEVK